VTGFDKRFMVMTSCSRGLLLVVDPRGVKHNDGNACSSRCDGEKQLFDVKILLQILILEEHVRHLSRKDCGHTVL